MVAINPRLSPHFERMLPAPWLPDRAIWRAVVIAYSTLGIGHLLFGSELAGWVCVLVALAASPRMRMFVGRGLRGLRHRPDAHRSADQSAS